MQKDQGRDDAPIRCPKQHRANKVNVTALRLAARVETSEEVRGGVKFLAPLPLALSDSILCAVSATYFVARPNSPQE